MALMFIFYLAIFGVVADASNDLLRREVPVSAHEHKVEREAVWAERIERHQANNSIYHGGLNKIDTVGGYYKCNGKTNIKLFVSKNSWMTKPANDMIAFVNTLHMKS